MRRCWVAWVSEEQSGQYNFVLGVSWVPRAFGKTAGFWPPSSLRFERPAATALGGIVAIACHGNHQDSVCPLAQGGKF